MNDEPIEDLAQVQAVRTAAEAAALASDTSLAAHVRAERIADETTAQHIAVARAVTENICKRFERADSLPAFKKLLAELRDSVKPKGE